MAEGDFTNIVALVAARYTAITTLIYPEDANGGRENGNCL
jgi:hypothetical protein